MSLDHYFSMIAVISMFCLGLRAITDEGMIGYPIRKFFQDKFFTIGKPLILCITCMSSFWGTVIYWSNMAAQGPIGWHMFPDYVGITISCAFINGLLWEYFQSINTCKH